MTLNVGSNKIKDIGAYGVYLGSQNTNCLTYTPKNVNLTLSNGTLTLKAGSKVYVPNGKNADGSNKFDEIVIESDVVNNDIGNSTTDLFLYSSSSGVISGWPTTICYSGATEPTLSGSWGVWYDTANNVIKMRTDTATSWTPTKMCLPFCKGTWTGSTLTSIDQIFDWCGYIGSTAFVLPGVKGLIPNGFNADGTYKVIEFETKGVLTATRNISGANKPLALASNSVFNYITLNYDKDTNFNRDAGGNIIGYSIVGTWSVDSSGVFTSLTPYTAQPATTTIPINAIYNGSEKVYQYLPNPTTFNAGSNLVTYTVPKGCTKLGIDCVASKGGTFKATGGNGGRVTCDLAVTAGQTLYITVGAIPTAAKEVIYNASDIRIGGTDYVNRVVVAGGGGNGSNGANGVSVNGVGGAGGGLTGGTGGTSNSAHGGAGGTQTEGGNRGGQGDYYGGSGANGTLGLGGAGASSGAGGNGGAGYYGGGGAAYGTYYDSWGGGGGGGSSYTSSACSNVVHTQGYQNGAGYIKITPKK